MIPTNDRGHFMLTNSQYNVVKKLVQVIMPAFSTLYFTLSVIWGLPAPDKVLGTIAGVATFLGVTLGISTREFESSGAAYDGVVTVTPNPEENTTIYNLQIPTENLENLGEKKSITLEVNPKNIPK